MISTRYTLLIRLEHYCIYTFLAEFYFVIYIYVLQYQIYYNYYIVYGCKAADTEKGLFYLHFFLKCNEMKREYIWMKEGKKLRS